MEQGSTAKCKSQVEGRRQLLGQGKSFAGSLEGLVWIAQQPQGPGCKALTNYPRVFPSTERSQGAVLLEIVERDDLLQVRSSLGKLSQAVEGLRQGIMSHEAKSRVLYILG